MSLRVLNLVVLTALFAIPLQLSAAPVDFQTEVQPILAEHCTLCHGVDEAERKSGLRLDLREGALAGGDSGLEALIPGDPDQSELIRRVLSTDPSEMMPPPNHNRPLKPEQIETLKRWVLEGGEYATHWAFTAPQKAPLPSVGVDHPIDALIVARLKERNLNLSAAADAATLCRRLYLDVIGIPPSPEQLIEFQRDGLEATVEKLLNSERYGEKWARHWLDVARYSDTNGYEKDLPRQQWKWRDWVIDSLNRDQPYNQFVLEQLAGDLLPNATQDQIIATGFLRNSMINEEGAIVPEQFRMVEMFDRMDCVGKAVLGLTIQCAQCHTHKFDPLTHDEYFGLFAFLNNAYEAQSWVYTPEQQQKIAEIEQGIAAVNERWKQARDDWQTELAAWENTFKQSAVGWEPLVATEMGSVSGLNHPTQEADLSLLMKGHWSNDVFMISKPELNGVTGLQLEALRHLDLPFGGPGRSSVGTWAMNELEVFIRQPGSEAWEKQKLVNATADFSEALKKLEEGKPESKKASGPVTHLIDGTDETTWNTDRGVGRRNQESVAVVQFEKPLTFPAGSEMKVVWRMTDMLGCARFSITRDASPTATGITYAACLAMKKPAAERSPDELAAIFNAWRQSVPESQPFNAEIDQLWAGYPQAGTSILHLVERPATDHRETHLLERGEWDQPAQPVEPHTPAIFHPFAADLPRNRLGLARWMTDSRSPLTARVAVNRVWQAIFGTGLVETPEDFGTRAPVPEYRDLLDWLAVDFMENGWSQKRLIRQIVTSAVYQQSSAVTPELQERDPNNLWLARGPRFRAEAEVVRDIALTVAGLMHHQLGGPGVIPPVPQNVLDYNYTYPSYWKPATGPERYRRAVYGFRKRSMPDPVMSNFDGPNGDLGCARRVRSNTPLAALTGLNEPIFVEAARALALRVLREGGTDDPQRIQHAFLLCMSRPATPAEVAVVQDLLDSRRKKLAEGWLNPREITTGDANQLPALPPETTPQDAAAWTLVARVLLNLDETISKK